MNKLLLMIFLKFLLVQLMELAVPLQMLFMQYLKTGIIPDCLKKAEIVPIYKSCDESLPSNYRPISLTLGDR